MLLTAHSEEDKESSSRFFQTDNGKKVFHELMEVGTSNAALEWITFILRKLLVEEKLFSSGEHNHNVFANLRTLLPRNGDVRPYELSMMIKSLRLLAALADVHGAKVQTAGAASSLTDDRSLLIPA